MNNLTKLVLLACAGMSLWGQAGGGMLKPAR